jgi:hypothetical protein
MTPRHYETGLTGPWRGRPGESRPACPLQITWDYLLPTAAGAGVGILKFVVSIIIAGVLLANAAGVIMEDVWSGKRIITIDLLGPEFL